MMAEEMIPYRTRLRSLDDTPDAEPGDGQVPVYVASTDSFAWGDATTDLTGYATTEYVDDAIATIELTPGPEGPQGEPGPAGPQGDPGVVAATEPLAYDPGTRTLSIDLDAVDQAIDSVADDLAAHAAAADPHAGYALLAGRAGGQTFSGGTASGESLTIQSTSDATRGVLSLVASQVDCFAPCRFVNGAGSAVLRAGASGNALIAQGDLVTTTGRYRGTNGSATTTWEIYDATTKASRLLGAEFSISDFDGARLNLAGGRGRGTGVGGACVIQVAHAGPPGSTQNALVDAITVASSGSAITIGFFGAAAVARPVLSYSRSGDGETAAGAAIRSALASLGLVTDSTTA